MKSERMYTRAEIEGRNTRSDIVVIIDNVVYNLSEFLNDHPGGVDVLLNSGGKDASQFFHEVGHSEIALDWRKSFRVGEVMAAERREVLPSAAPAQPDAPTLPSSFASALNTWGPPLMLGAFAALVYGYLL